MIRDAEAVAARCLGAHSDRVSDVAERLDAYVALLKRWQKVQNLVSRETLSQVWDRHIADSLQALRFLPPVGHTVDVGSGGGFPAIPLAIASRGTGRTFTLYEPNARKVSFLRTVSRELDLPVTVHSERIEAAENLTADVVTSRATARLALLLDLCAAIFRQSTPDCVFHKGREHGEELLEARIRWDFDAAVYPSETDPQGAILVLKDLKLRAGSSLGG